jgi:cell division protein YceG involved in septum cleavage
MRLVLRLFSWCLVAFVSASLTTAGWLYFYYQQPETLAENKTILIPRGTSLPQIVEILRQEDVIHNRFSFLAVAGLISRQRTLKAGEYLPLI